MDSQIVWIIVVVIIISAIIAAITGKGLQWNSRDIVLLVLAILLPPLAVGLKRGIDSQFLLNCVLAIFCWVPAIIHAIWLIIP